jgi:hypothetical protein
MVYRPVARERDRERERLAVCAVRTWLVPRGPVPVALGWMLGKELTDSVWLVTVMDDDTLLSARDPSISYPHS